MPQRKDTSNIPHEPGAIANQTWGKDTGQQPSDLVDGYVIGQDNTTGQAIVSDGASQLRGEVVGDINIYQFAAFERPESASGGRNGRVRSLPGDAKIFELPAITQQSQPDPEIDGCEGDETDENQTNENFELDELPEDPAEQGDPGDLAEPPVDVDEVASDDPNNPQPDPSEESTLEGCSPEDECQWYYAPSIDAACPAGTIKKSGIELSTGEFMILCCGPDRPVGDGCPDDEVGWECVDGTCTLVTGGRWATQEECEQNCTSITWTCTPDGCVSVTDGSGEFATEAECLQQCSAQGWECVGGACQQIEGGRYATRTECENSGCGFGTATENIYYCTGFASAVLRWEVDGQTEEIESTNTPIRWNLTGSGTSTIEVDWGGGDIDYLTGETWSEEIIENCGTANLLYGGSTYIDQPIPPDATTANIVSLGGFYNCSSYFSQNWGLATNSGYTYRSEIPNGCMGATPTCPLIQNDPTSLEAWSKANPLVVANGTSAPALISITPGVTTTKVTSNTGEFSERETITPPTVSLVPPYVLSINDSTGIIFEQGYDTEPINFVYACRN